MKQSVPNSENRSIWRLAGAVACAVDGRRAVEANNEEVAAGTGMSPNEYMDRFVRDGKQAVAKAVDGDDTERTAKAERELERQKGQKGDALYRR